MPSKQPKSSRAPGGPVRRDTDITAQEEALANEIDRQASYQESPLTDPSQRPTARATRTGRLADEAAGIESHRDQLDNAERAFTQSRGSHGSREKGYQRDNE
jgi:hypothetical protein